MGERDGIMHASDCAVHNMPGYPARMCDCGATQAVNITRDEARLLDRIRSGEAVVMPRRELAETLNAAGLHEDMANNVINQLAAMLAAAPKEEEESDG